MYTQENLVFWAIIAALLSAIGILWIGYKIAQWFIKSFLSGIERPLYPYTPFYSLMCSSFLCLAIILASTYFQIQNPEYNQEIMVESKIFTINYLNSIMISTLSIILFIWVVTEKFLRRLIRKGNPGVIFPIFPEL